MALSSFTWAVDCRAVLPGRAWARQANRAMRLICLPFLTACLIRSEDVEKWWEVDCPEGYEDCRRPEQMWWELNSMDQDSAGETGEGAEGEEVDGWLGNCTLNEEEWDTEGGCVTFPGLVTQPIGCSWVDYTGGYESPVFILLEFPPNEGVNLDLQLFSRDDTLHPVASSQRRGSIGEETLSFDSYPMYGGILRIWSADGALPFDVVYSITMCTDGSDPRDTG